MNFIFSWQEQYLTSEPQQTSKNIKFISSRHRVVSSISQAADHSKVIFRYGIHSFRW